MKTINKISKTALLCVLLLTAKSSFAQLLPTTFNTIPGQCVDLGFDSMLAPLGFRLDTFNVLSNLWMGQLVPGGGPNSWLYCRDSTSLGVDSATVYVCISGPVFPICDTMELFFVVGCNVAVTIQPGPCAGPLPSLQASVTGGTPPFQYLWSNGVSSDVVCNLTTGTYCVTVIDANNCSASSCQFVSGGGCNLVLYPDSTPCMGPLPSVGFGVFGGTPPYTYQWSDGSTNSFICNMTPGVYCLTVTDAQGCSDSLCDTVLGCQLAVTIARDSSGCLITAVSGGTSPYSYQWSDGSTGSILCNINPLLTYSVTVTDNNGCAGTATLTGPCQMFSTITTSGSCLFITTSGGNPPFIFEWSDGSVGPTICPNTPGYYCVTVTDSWACTNSLCDSIGGGCQLNVTIALDSMNCGGGNGLLVITSGGTSPYTYLWSDGTTGSINCNLNPGTTYSVTVVDANGCSGTAWYFDPGCQITVAVVYDSINNCYTATASGANPPFLFLWSDNSTGSSVCNVVPGSVYCVTITDANGCTGSSCSNQNQRCSFSHTQASLLSPPVVIFVASFDPLFNPSSVVWNFGDGSTGIGFQITHTYAACNNVMPVTMTLTDSVGNNLCSYSQSIYVYCDSLNNFCQAYFGSFQDSSDNMTFHFKDRSVYNPVSYAWDFGDGTSDTAKNPIHTYTTPGIYNVCVVVTDANGCSSTYCQLVNAGNVQIQDLAAYLHHYTTVTPGFPLWTSLSYCNYGTTMMNGTVEYRYPSGTTFVSATPPPTSHNPSQRLLIFTFSNLLPGTCGSIAVDLAVGQQVPLGSVANDTLWVKPITGDINPADNVSTISDVVVGSWDPNDKAVSPKGLGDDGEIPVSTQTLSYKIRFQNTGTASAQNVVIRDAMDSNIDLSSVKVMDASHEHITQIIGIELVVTFNNIMLPDSNTNEPESHGSILVVANLKPGLAEGTQIFNTAEIYFDFNPSVITNTVVNTLQDIGTNITDVAGLEFSIMPNPAQDEIIISGKFSRSARYEVLNELGQVVQNGDVNSDKTTIVIKQLDAGIYFLKIKTNNQTGVQRLVVTK